MTTVWAILLAVICFVGWGLNLVGIPGNWLNVLAVAIYAWLMPDDLRQSIGWPVVVVALVLAIVGEAIEFAAGALGVSKVGGTRRGALLAIVGSLLGGFLGIFVGLPIPVIGQVIAILFCASLGAWAGALLGERWAGRSMEHALDVGHAAFWGRLFGTLGKIMAGSVIVAVVLSALLLR